MSRALAELEVALAFDGAGGRDVAPGAASADEVGRAPGAGITGSESLGVIVSGSVVLGEMLTGTDSSRIGEPRVDELGVNGSCTSRERLPATEGAGGIAEDGVPRGGVDGTPRIGGVAPESSRPLPANGGGGSNGADELEPLGGGPAIGGGGDDDGGTIGGAGATLELPEARAP